MVHCKVILLDGTDYDVDIDKQSKGQELLDTVCHRLNVNEKDYFSFTYKDDKNNKLWLNSEKKINKQVSNENWVFSFVLKFYPADPLSVQQEGTRYQIFLQMRTDILSGKLPCSFVTHALLGSYAVQSQLGDYDPADHGSGFRYLKDISFAPNQSQELLEKIAELHRTHRGQLPSEAEAHYLDNASKVSLYGIHLYSAKNEEGGSVEIGICAAGLLIFKERLRINRFTWPKILKLSYKRNIFTIKIRPGEFEQMETTIDFKLISYDMSKRLWKMCVEHHAFFRLREIDPAPRGLFARFAPKYRYSGRTQYQTHQTASGQSNRAVDVKRVVGRRFTGSKSMETVITGYSTERSEQYQQDDQHTATLDLRGHHQGSLPLLDNPNFDADYCHYGSDIDCCSRTSAGDFTVDHDERVFLTSKRNGSEHYVKTAPNDPRYNQQQHPPGKGGVGGRIQYHNTDWNASLSRDGTRDHSIGSSHDTERDGVIDDCAYTNTIDYDKALSDAILAVTKMNLDLTVEKIEIETKEEAVAAETLI